MDFNKLLLTEAQSKLSTSRCGFITSYHLSNLVDTLLNSDFNEVASDSNLVLLAVGGYGRRELAPFSDIDIMILARQSDESSRKKAEELLYRFWDKGINLSHSFRTIDEALEDSLKDMQTRTAIIDCRRIAGSEQLWKEFLTEAYQKILYRGKRDLIKTLISELLQRHKSYSLSVYQLEPNIKEGRGGLRDIHTLLWLCRVTKGIRDFEGLSSLMSPIEFRLLKRAFEFILRTRIALHILSKSKNEVLSFDYQEGLSEMMGFRNTSRFLSSEIFMRVYYRHTRTIMESLHKIVRSCSQDLFKSFPVLFVKRLSDNFSLSKNEIILNKGCEFKDQATLLEAFYLYSVTGREFSQRLQGLIRKRQVLINRKKLASMEALEFFKKILRGRRVYETLCEMHRLNILDRLIPDFGRLRYLVVHEPYHRYTVDEHTLRAIKNLEDLYNNRQPLYPLLKELSQEIDPFALYLALLLHDIGKGIYGSGLSHESEGYKTIKDTLENLDLGRDIRKLVEFLVKNHLLLSKTALKRDTETIETITSIADTVGDEVRLKALMLVTYADMSAVNPEYFNEWKAQMLFDLYKRVYDHIKGIKRSLCLTAETKGFLSIMPEHYVLTTPPEEIEKDRVIFETALKGEPAVEIRSKGQDTVELIVSAKDARCLFLRIVSQIGNLGINIVKARLYRTKNDMILDKILLTNFDHLMLETLRVDIAKELSPANPSLRPLLEGMTEDNYVERFSKRRASALPSHLVNFKPFVEIDNESSDTSSIIEIFAGDRIGLLYDMAQILSLFEVDIISAVINTEDKIAQDVFYVQYRGKKLKDIRALSVLKALYHVVS